MSLHSPDIENQIYKDPLGLRVFHGIVYCLLAYAQKIVLNRLRQRPEGAIDFNLSLDRSLIRQSARSLAQCTRQIIIFEHRRAQIPNIAA